MSIQEVRRAKLQALQERGIQPYAYRYDATHRSAAIRADHAALEASGQPVRVAGRLMTKRGHGKASFAHLKDEDGLLQIYLREDALGAEDYAQALEFGNRRETGAGQDVDGKFQILHKTGDECRLLNTRQEIGRAHV